MALGTAAALVGSLMIAVPAFSHSHEGTTFDLDHGNAPIQVIYPKFSPVSQRESFGRPMSWTADHHMLVEIPWFDALAAYHPTAVGIISNLGRRPLAEHTTRNKNIAVIYAAFTSLNAVYPEYRSSWLEMMESAGLDPNDTAEDPTTPSGIGILAAKNALATRKNDGVNRHGDEGRKYNGQPYADYTGYKPVNSVHHLRHPSRWQPNVTSKRNVFTVQEFATPQYGRVKPFSYDSPEQFDVPPPPNDYYTNRNGYRRQADEIVKASASLDDRKKMIAELFDDDVRPFGPIAGGIVIGGGLSTEESVHYIVTSVVSGIDVTIASWYFKRKYDSVRPFSAIGHLYGKKKLKAWGGPGKGTVMDITGNEWRSYISELASPSPEYPSAVAADCIAYAQQARRFTGSDSINVFIPVPKGSSLVEPGLTPAADMTLHWNNLTDFVSDCGKSRVWGGENFPSSVDAANRYASQIGDLAYEFIQRKLNGG